MADGRVIQRLDTKIDKSTLATGGAVYDLEINGTLYRIHEFTSSGTFEILKGIYTIDFLIVGGGGGGGGRAGGGGGAGELVFKTNFPIETQTYNITVGSGGNGDLGNSSSSGGQNGSDSAGFGYTAKGGGRGGFDGHSESDLHGGSGGGQMYNYGRGPGHSTAEQGIGNRGGFGVNKNGTREDGVNVGGEYSAGGGGGAGLNGEDVPDGAAGGNGGAGINFVNFFGTGFGEDGFFAGGGGGGTHPTADSPGLGGKGGGGNANGADTNADGDSGMPNTGGGGGGGTTDGGTGGNGGNGGSGVALIRYRLE